MDKQTLRIIDTITSRIGDSLTINQLTERIKETYGSAYYANVYQKIRAIEKEGLLKIESIGKSSSLKLNFQNYILIDEIAEMEIEKKINFLTKRNNLLPFLTELDTSFHDTCTIKSIISMNPSRTVKLNRMDLLFVLGNTINYHDETIEICKEMQRLQNKHNLKINNLIINKDDFSELSTSDEINPVREALSQKIIFLYPQIFWSIIKEIEAKNKIHTITTETKPSDISESTMAFNLNRFGYKEFGLNLTQSDKICIEYIITAILLQEDARKTDATAIILAKNNFKSNILCFLSQKFQTTGKLLGILKVLQEIKPTPEINKTIALLKTFKTEEQPADGESIRKNMRLYNAL